MNSKIIQVTVTEVQAEYSQSQKVLSKPTSTISVTSEALLLLFFGLFGLGMIATFITKELYAKKEHREVNGKATKIPCPNCKYFSKSSYLRCAVQPQLTMTNEATECPDFTAPHQN